jgi:hypothetical protein
LLGTPLLTAGPRDFYRSYLPGMIVLGIAMGVSVAPLSTAVMNAFPSDRSGVASGINSMLGRLSSVLGVAIVGSVALLNFDQVLMAHPATLALDSTARARLAATTARFAEAQVPPDLSPASAQNVGQAIDAAFVDSFRKVCRGSAVVVWAGALGAAVLMREPSASGTQR